MPAKRDKVILLAGGENLVTPDIALPAGTLRATYNYESAIGGGYGRVGGYERWDGRAAPSDQNFWTLGYREGDGVNPVIGTVITCTDTGAIGTVTTVLLPASGTFAGSDAFGVFIISGLDGDMPKEGAIMWPGGTAVIEVAAIRNDNSVTLQEFNTYLDDAATYFRNQIMPVPGSGPVRGVVSFNGKRYAFRNTEDATAGIMYEGSTSGWQPVALSKQLQFNLGRTIWKLAFKDGSVAPGANGFVVGEDSQTVAAIEQEIVESGTYGGGDAAGYLLVSAPEFGAGAFIEDENLEFIAEKTGEYAAVNAITVGALDEARKMEIGNTLRDAGGNTFIVGNVQTLKGSYAEGNASGVLTIKDSVGADTISGSDLQLIIDGTIFVTAAVQTSAAFVPTINPDGHYDLVIENAYADADREAIYGVNGVSKAFEFRADGVFSLIYTNMDESPGGIPGPLDFGGHGEDRDKPTHVAFNKQHLWFIFPGGSLQNSSLGNPTEWNGVTGAGEYAIGDEGVGLARTNTGGTTGDTQDVLLVLGRNRTKVMVGSSVNDFELRSIATDSGCIEWSVQELGRPRYLDDRGMTDVVLQPLYGNLQAGTFSEPIDVFLKDKKRRGIGVSASIRMRDKNIHRMFFEDGGILSTMFDSRGGEDIVEFTRQRYLFNAFCAFSGEDAEGNEVLLVGGDDGYVYQLDRGRSFDGEEIEYALRTVQHYYRSSSQSKRFYDAVVQLEVQSSFTLFVTAEFDLALVPSSYTTEHLLKAAGGFWEVSRWSEFTWNGGTIAEAFADIDGNALNMGLIIGGRSKFDLPHTLKTVFVEYEPRGRRPRR